MKNIMYVIFFILFLMLVILDVTVKMDIFLRLINPLIVCVILCLYRIIFGPTPADRSVAVDVLGIVVVGACGLLGFFTKKDFFIDIGIAWALQSFIGTIALAKYLEGRKLDE